MYSKHGNVHFLFYLNGMLVKISLDDVFMSLAIFHICKQCKHR